jgi:hypothetical protein
MLVYAADVRAPTTPWIEAMFTIDPDRRGTISGRTSRGEVGRPQQARPKALVPFVRRGGNDVVPRAKVRRVVAQHVDPPTPGRGRLSDGGGDLRLVRHVNVPEGSPPAAAADAGDRGFSRRVIQVRHQHPRPFLGEQFGDGTADPVGRAGHDRDLVGQPHRKARQRWFANRWPRTPGRCARVIV